MQNCTTRYNNDGGGKKSAALRGGKRVSSSAARKSDTESTVISAFKEGHRINETEIKGSKHLLSRSALLLALYTRKITTVGGADSAELVGRESQSVATAFTTVFTLDCILKIARCHYATMKKRKEFRLKRRLRTLDKNAKAVRTV